MGDAEVVVHERLHRQVRQVLPEEIRFSGVLHRVLLDSIIGAQLQAATSR